MLSERDQLEAVSSQDLRELEATQAAVDEQSGQTVELRRQSGGWSSGGEGRDTDGVLEVGAGQPVLLLEVGEGLAGPKRSEDVLEPRSTAAEDRLPEAAAWVGDDVRSAVLREPD